LKEFTDGESNFTALLQKAMEMEGVDRETLHQLICLLMKVSTLICCVAVASEDAESLLHCVVQNYTSTGWWASTLRFLENCCIISCFFEICFSC